MPTTFPRVLDNADDILVGGDSGEEGLGSGCQPTPQNLLGSMDSGQTSQPGTSRAIAVNTSGSIAMERREVVEDADTDHGSVGCREGRAQATSIPTIPTTDTHTKRKKRPKSAPPVKPPLAASTASSSVADLVDFAPLLLPLPPVALEALEPDIPTATTGKGFMAARSSNKGYFKIDLGATNPRAGSAIDPSAGPDSSSAAGVASEGAKSVAASNRSRGHRRGLSLAQAITDSFTNNTLLVRLSPSQKPIPDASVPRNLSPQPLELDNPVQSQQAPLPTSAQANALADPIQIPSLLMSPNVASHLNSKLISLSPPSTSTNNPPLLPFSKTFPIKNTLVAPVSSSLATSSSITSTLSNTSHIGEIPSTVPHRRRKSHRHHHHHHHHHSYSRRRTRHASDSIYGTPVACSSSLLDDYLNPEPTSSKPSPTFSIAAAVVTSSARARAFSLTEGASLAGNYFGRGSYGNDTTSAQDSACLCCGGVGCTCCCDACRREVEALADAAKNVATAEAAVIGDVPSTLPLMPFNNQVSDYFS
ncbi:hypothetical protein BC830DRAFT_392842 [Chytriomyces sp. MP71]|nr:hypothetical protein BC830DRAFT_392842 [Chytriomyces sp. MP71]